MARSDGSADAAAANSFNWRHCNLRDAAIDLRFWRGGHRGTLPRHCLATNDDTATRDASTADASGDQYDRDRDNAGDEHAVSGDSSATGTENVFRAWGTKRKEEMSITQEPPVAEVLCYQCSGLGKLRITFGDPPQWAKCGKCGGTGKLHRSGGVFVGVLPDLSEVVREEKEAFGKRKNFEQCGVESRHATAMKCADTQSIRPSLPTYTLKSPDAGDGGRDVSQEFREVGLASDHCSIPLCANKVAMIHEGGRYCAKHGMEVLK